METKPFYNSLSFRGIVIMLIPVIVKLLKLAGIEVAIPNEELADLLIQAIGGVVAIIGVLRRKDIHVKPQPKEEQ